MLPSSTTLQTIDRLSQNNMIKLSKPSRLGILATLILIAISLALYLPPAISYSNGNYTQSTFLSRKKTQNLTFYSKDDFKLAMVFKHRKDGSLFDHSKILQNLGALIVFRTESNMQLRQALIVCDKNQFSTDINGQVLGDCLKVPDKVQFELKRSLLTYTSLRLTIDHYGSTPPFGVPSSITQAAFSNQQKYFVEIFQDYYYEIIFSYKTLAPDGSEKFIMKKLSSTELNVGSQNIAAHFTIVMSIRQFDLDISILPWRNQQEKIMLDWQGQVARVSNFDAFSTVRQGIDVVYTVTNGYLTTNRIYKKLDWLLGIIGGGVFLIYLMILFPMSYFNSGLLKIELANQLLLQKLTERPETEEGLAEVQIPKIYLIQRLIPFCKDAKKENILEQVKNQNDICLLIKKMKVAIRNLKKNNFEEQFNAKIVIFKEQGRIFQEQSQNESQKATEHSESKDNGVLNQHKEIQNLIKDKTKKQLQQKKLRKSPKRKLQQKNLRRFKLHKIQLPAAIQQQKQQDEEINDLSKRKLRNKNSKIIQEGVMQGVDVYAALQMSNNKLLQNQEQDPQDSVQPFEQDDEQNDDAEIDRQKGPQQLQQANQNHEESNSSNNNNSFQQELIDIQQIEEDEHILNQQSNILQQKFNLSALQLDHIKHNQYLEKYFENTPAFLILKEEPTESFQEIMEMETFDKWQGQFQQKKCEVRTKIADFIRKFDIFGVKYQFVSESHNKTIFGSLIMLLIIGLSILTFCLTIANSSNIQYKIQSNYVAPENLYFQKQTSSTFNMILCLNFPIFFWGSRDLYPNVNFTFFTSKNGNVQHYAPQKLNDNTLNFKNLISDYSFYDVPSDCYKFAANISILMNPNSHFGYQMSPLCLLNATQCAERISTTNRNYLSSVNRIEPLLLLPAYDFDPKNFSLYNNVKNISFQTINQLTLREAFNIQDTFQVGQIQVYSDVENSLLRPEPKLIEHSINTDFTTRRARWRNIADNNTQYTMRIKLGPTVNRITLQTKRINWILGVIGGIIFFWYALLHILSKLYSRFNFYLYLSKIIYEEQFHSQGFMTKFIAMIHWPRRLIPKFLGIREQVTRMRLIDDKLQNSLTHLSLLKYTENCYRLSAAFFSSIAAKNMSLIYFRDKIDEKVYIQNSIAQKKINLKDEDFAIHDYIEVNEAPKTNHIFNADLQHQHIKTNQQKAGVNTFGDYAMKEERQDGMRIQKEQQTDNIIQKVQSDYANYFNAYPQQSQFFFNKNKKSVSVLGGILSVVMIVLIILLSLEQIRIYFNRNLSISNDYQMDLSNEGLTLITGQNFKLGLNFINSSNLYPIDMTTNLQNISIILQQQVYERVNSDIISTITTFPLIPCESGYLQSWMSKTVDVAYYQFLRYSYCVPNGLVLALEGGSSDKIKKSFQISIVNRYNNQTNVDFLNAFLSSAHVQFHFSSPQHNSITREIKYQINTEIFKYFTSSNPFASFQTNVTLSKLKVTYEDSTNWDARKKEVTSYSYEPYTKYLSNFQYRVNSKNVSWYNVSFSYTKKMQIYEATSSKFVEAFGIIGGITFIAFLMFGCCINSFNKYKMKYQIGKELYLFDKLRIVYQKDKIRKLPKKTKKERYQFQKMNNYSELSLFQAYFFSLPAYLMKDFNFNRTLRRITSVQERATNDLSLLNFYHSLYKTRDTINKQVQKNLDLNFKLTDFYFKKIVNDQRIPYTLSGLKNYAKQHKLSSYAQVVVMRAIQSRIKIRQIFDKKLLEQLFNLIDDGASINLGRLSDTYNSVESNQNESDIKSAGNSQT